MAVNLEGRSGVYTIWIKDRPYVGSALDLRVRLMNEMSQLPRGKHHNTFLQRAYDKYGWEAVRLGDIEFCTKSELRKFELIVMDRLEEAGFQLFNIDRDPSTPPMAGRHHTEEAKQKMREAKERQWEDPEYQEGMYRLHKGSKRSDETKRKIGEASERMWQDPEYIEKMKKRKSPLGLKRSDETKQKLREIQTGKKHSPETIEKMKASQQARRRRERRDGTK